MKTISAHNEKGMNLRLVLMVLDHQYKCPAWFSKLYRAITNEFVARNYEIEDFSGNGGPFDTSPGKKDELDNVLDGLIHYVDKYYSV